MRKPRASQRKVVLSSSEDDGDSRPKDGSLTKSRSQPKSPKSPKTPKATQSVISLLSSPGRDSVSQPSLAKRESSEHPLLSQSPRKSKGRTQPKGKAQSLPQGKTLHSFFAAASQSQSSETSGIPKKIIKAKDALDIIQDDALDNASDISTSTHEGREDRRRYKRAHGSADGYNESLLGGSQKFRKTSAVTKVHAEVSVIVPQPSDFQPWTDKYAPVNLSELAVHKRKVDEVRQWLNDVHSGRIRKSVLVLRGPAGAGKSTTVTLLAREIGIHLQEWKSHSSSNHASEGFISAAAQFDDFLNRAGKYGYLEIEEGDTTSTACAAASSGKIDKQAIFVEEFPLSSLQGSSSALRTFRSSILKYLAVHTPSTALTWKNASSSKSITPLILLVSESLLNCSSISDIFTAHRLFGTELLAHHGVTVIDFNPIAPTLLLKGLDLITRKEAKNRKRETTPSQSLLRKLAESGDMRSAVSSLEFIYLQGGHETWEVEETKSRAKHTLKNNVLTSIEKDTLEVITQREMSLGLFHAVGKVVYNKRDNTSGDGEVPLPPTFMPEHARSKASDVNFNNLIDELGTDVDTFVSALHENYILSCNAGSAEDTLDSIIGCIDALSDTDLLVGKKDTAARNRSNAGGGSSQTWRQDEILFNVATRGIVFALPYPVRRSNATKSVGKSRPAGNTAFKMYYPKSFRLWRQKEEIWDLLDLLVQRSQRGELCLPLTKVLPAKSKARMSDFANLAFRPKGGRRSSTEKAVEPIEEGQKEKKEQVHSSGSTTARYEMLLERIPYISMLDHARQSCSPHMKDIDRLAHFIGIDSKGDELSDSDDEVAVRATTTFNSAVKKEKENNAAAAIASLDKQTTDKYTLSDDDIVDD